MQQVFFFLREPCRLSFVSLGRWDVQSQKEMNSNSNMCRVDFIVLTGRAALKTETLVFKMSNRPMNGIEWTDICQELWLGWLLKDSKHDILIISRMPRLILLCMHEASIDLRIIGTQTYMINHTIEVVVRTLCWILVIIHGTIYIFSGGVFLGKELAWLYADIEVWFLQTN